MLMADEKYMELAILEAWKASPVDTAYCVGCVLVNAAGEVVSSGYSRELVGNTHAEQCALQKLEKTPDVATNLTMYTTMEPCSERLSKNQPCVKSCIDSGLIARVVIGAMEPSNFIDQCQGAVLLEKAGIHITILRGYREKCLAPNRHLI